MDGSSRGSWKCQLSTLLVLLCLFIVSADGVAETAIRQTPVRRHEDIGGVLSSHAGSHNITVNSNKIAAVSSHGVIIAEAPAARMRSERDDVAVAKAHLAYPGEPIAAAKLHTPTMPLPNARLYRIVRAHLKPYGIWRASLFAKHLGRPSEAKTVSGQATTSRKVSGQDYGTWTLYFLMSLLCLGFACSHIGGSMKVDPHPEDEFYAYRGRACWAPCCAFCVMVLASCTFLLTLLSLSAISSSHTSSSDAYVIDDASGNVRIAQHPGERAFESGFGVALSAACFALVILQRRHRASLRISSGLLSQFAIRGATFSIVMASVLELSGIFAVNQIAGAPVRDFVPSDKDEGNSTSLFAGALLMLLVGVSEELAKAIAVIGGTWLNPSALSTTPPVWYAGPWRVLVESRRAVMLAGLSAGCGFMTLENAGYLLSTGIMYEKGESAVAERIMRCIVVSVRVFLNLHPWLAGITSARIARVCFQNNRNLLGLTLAELVWALAPSVALHAAFDFSLLALPGLLAIFLPFVFWFGARSLFDQEWMACDERNVQTSDPVENTPTSRLQ